ncbi:MAG: DUF4159 domain-containing protein [Deltaproteobacteria bacterium]|nr:DUF4159 domain-containing protein [Deltaproteobacteria bacterium]
MSNERSRLLLRRDLLRLGLASLAGLLLPGRAEAFGASSKLIFALLDHGSDPDPRPTALRRLAWEIVKRTSIDCELDTVRLKANSPALFKHPLLVLTGRQGLPPLSASEAASLRRYLTYGGTLFVDSTEGGPGSAFDRSVRELLLEVFPKQRLAPIERDHVLYKSFYLLESAGGRVVRRPYLEGIQHDDRYAVIYSQNDYLGAWARDDLGTWEMEMDARRRELSFRFGVNLVMYALCLDYKDDQVHLPFILKRRKT